MTNQTAMGPRLPDVAARGRPLPVWGASDARGARGIGAGRPAPIVVVSRQPLLRTSIRQLADGLGYAGPLFECGALAELSTLPTAARRAAALILFREIGEQRFYDRLERQLRGLDGTPRVVLFSETLGEGDWDAIEAGRVSLLLPSRIERATAQRLLSPLFVGSAALAAPERERARRIVAELRSLFMTDIQDLSAAELEVVTQLQRGLSNREIARSLGVHLCQIKKILHEVSTKLAVSGRVNIATLTRRQIQLQARSGPHPPEPGAGFRSGG